jgi:hypothetical protein
MKLVSRLFAAYAIQIRGGSARCVKGTMVSRMMSDISSLASEVNLKEGEIWINQLGKVSFSREVPEAIHQRIRNVISSH